MQWQAWRVPELHATSSREEVTEQSSVQFSNGLGRDDKHTSKLQNYKDPTIQQHCYRTTRWSQHYRRPRRTITQSTLLPLNPSLPKVFPVTSFIGMSNHSPASSPKIHSSHDDPLSTQGPTTVSTQTSNALLHKEQGVVTTPTRPLCIHRREWLRSKGDTKIGRICFLMITITRGSMRHTAMPQLSLNPKSNF